MIGLLCIFGITYLLIATEKVDKSIAACLGAAAMIGTHYIHYDKAIEHIDMNVVFLLTGMMIIVNVLGRTGVFEWLSVKVVKTARGRAVPIIVLLVTVTAVLSMFLDNVTTVILIAPITILIAQILELPAMPILVLEAIFSNIGGAATLVGDPPNVLIGSRADLTFNEFLINLGPPAALVLVITLAVVLVWIRKYSTTQSARERILRAKEALAITEPKRLAVGLGVFSLVLAGFFLGPVLDLEPGIVALGGALLMVLLTRTSVHHVLEKVEWTTIFFFIGLFMLVGALQENGLFEMLGEEVSNVTQGNLLLAVIAILWVSAIASAIVDNIPLVIAMIPLIQSMIPRFAAQMALTGQPDAIRAQVTEPLFWALALGACLGGNGTLVGASANVVIAQIARKNKYPLTFWAFTKVGLPLMLLSMVICTAYLYCRYFLF